MSRDRQPGGAGSGAGRFSCQTERDCDHNRHTYATSLVRRDEDIHVVQRLMGHSNIATTSRYLHLVGADLLAAVDREFPEGCPAIPRWWSAPPGTCRATLPAPCGMPGRPS
jgi:hypothetical protein